MGLDRLYVNHCKPAPASSHNSFGDNASMALFGKMFEADQAAPLFDRKSADALEGGVAPGQVIAEGVEITHEVPVGSQSIPQVKRHTKHKFMDVLDTIGRQKRGQRGAGEALLPAHGILSHVDNHFDRMFS
jgi:hypothetical protein